MNVVLVGAGGVASSVGPALLKAGHKVSAVWSRRLASASLLGQKLNTEFSTSLETLPKDADVYVVAVADEGVADVARRLYVPEGALCIHTAGSLPMSVLSGMAKWYGVFYPMQTFSREREVDFDTVPCFIEASSNAAMRQLRKFAASLSSRIFELSGKGRARLHVAAVFACNFTNHCYALAEELLKSSELPFELLLPLIDETTKKVHTLSPRLAQTGPAVRGDKAVMTAHMEALMGDRIKARLYKLMSDDIQRMSIHEDKVVKKICET